MKFSSSLQIHENELVNYGNSWPNLRNLIFNKQGRAYKRKILSINGGQSTIIQSYNSF